ncbi:hypothetical protein B4135_1284 [Caldibacillus debilis]|uniref:Uncharacterized protein n=1 Tax=Caldibacillus debilis TaxID=301148 RepID=A0A150MD29_9BACI|nr:hypothetical protein B4135_1284 [Caldibacillus debilis]
MPVSFSFVYEKGGKFPPALSRILSSSSAFMTESKHPDERHEKRA